MDWRLKWRGKRSARGEERQSRRGKESKHRIRLYSQLACVGLALKVYSFYVESTVIHSSHCVHMYVAGYSDMCTLDVCSRTYTEDNLWM